MSSLIDFLMFRGEIERLTTLESLTWFEETMVVLLILHHFAWIVFLIILPFGLIFILISLARRLGKNG